MFAVAMQAQITQVSGTVSDETDPLIGAVVCEVDGNGRVIESAITDINGNFSMKIRNPKDKIKFSYVGYKTQTLPINKTVYDIVMESEGQLKEVTVVAKKRLKGNGLALAEDEVSFSTQSLSTKNLDGLSVTSIEEAMQGRIAGLDIVANSGNLGSGSTMRLRGTSSLSSLTSSNPLIVIDGNVWEDETGELATFDLGSSSDEQFAQLLRINPEDIDDIQVLKGASTSMYGPRGGSGVIEITTKRGTVGRPQLTYSFKLSGTYQPKGYDLLSGDDYTMLLKESYFNPEQSDAAADVPEINYDPQFSEYEQYNNNTDWVDAVTQWGLRQNHYITISGGGEKARFRISGGFDHETGSVIKQQLDRFSTRVNLDYFISKRIRVSTNFALTYTNNHQNSDNLLSIALVKMPNMSIYEQDRVTGENTDRYYNMLQSGPNIGSKVFENDQRKYVNPVASANLAKYESRSYDMVPELIMQYQLLGLDKDHWQLEWRGAVNMNISNRYIDSYYPSELVSTVWQSGHNTSYNGNSKNVQFTTRQELTLTPYTGSDNHKIQVKGMMELVSGSSSGQYNNGKGLPSGNITSPDAGGLITGLSSSFGEWRSLYFTGFINYILMDRYIFYTNVNVTGTTKFGPGRRWGYFPGATFRWNIVKEKFMEKFYEDKIISTLGIRAGWSISGSAPRSDYLYTSKYAQTDTYLDMAAMRPVNIRLNDLQWETIEKLEAGLELGFWDDKLRFTLDVYRNTTKDMLMGGYRIPSNAGFTRLDYKNNGSMRNMGWEFYINGNNVIKKGKFSLDFNVNFGNNRNEILSLDENLLKNLNSVFTYENAKVLQRVQLHNPFGAIYGFRYKGVYQYNYDTFADMNEEQRNQFIAEGKTAPVAMSADGNVIIDDKGMPVRMQFGYSNDPAQIVNYKFSGGDAIYEDINNDGNINALDIVYLGSSLPKLTGGFGFVLKYDKWRFMTQFSYRVGNKILNMARLNNEAMTNNNNQSQAVNYRWRKEGDVTTIPRAMYGNTSNYNTLVSDRFVEDGSFLRMNYAQVSYLFKAKFLRNLGINSMNFYASINNPFVLTKYTGVDPEVNYGGYGAATDWGQTPRARSYTGGITFDF